MIIPKSKRDSFKKFTRSEFCGNIPKRISWITVVVLSALSISSFAQKKFKSGGTFRDCPDCPEMVIIPAGNFMMGSPASEEGRGAEEGPQRQVSITSFAAGKFDITRGQWAEFVKATNRLTSGGCAWSFLPGKGNPGDLNDSASWRRVGFKQDDNHPVVCISPGDVQDYLNWLNKKTGSKYRLLTEAEWEYAARAGTTTPYPWGSIASHEFANYGSDFGVGDSSGRDKWVYSTSPSGSFPPNKFGLYDMHGNVMQWVEDCFSWSYLGLPADGSAYKMQIQLKMTGDLSWVNGKSSCDYKMLRGSGFAEPASRLRSASRNFAAPPPTSLNDYRNGGVGFRVAKTL